MSNTDVVNVNRNKKNPVIIVRIPLLLFDLAYRKLKKMKGDLKKLWGILSGKPSEPRQPRLRSTSLPRITSYGLIGFGTYEYIPKKERRCSPLWYDYDVGKKLCNTFPRRTKQKTRPNIPGRQRSLSVSVEVRNNSGSGSLVQHRRGSTTKYFKVDIDETIKEDEVLDIDELKRVLTSFDEDEKENQGTLTTDLCSTDL